MRDRSRSDRLGQHGRPGRVHGARRGTHKQIERVRSQDVVVQAANGEGEIVYPAVVTIMVYEKWCAFCCRWTRVRGQEHYTVQATGCACGASW